MDYLKTANCKKVNYVFNSIVSKEIAFVAKVRRRCMHTVPLKFDNLCRDVALTCLTARSAVMRRADALVRFPTVSSVQAPGLA